MLWNEAFSEISSVNCEQQCPYSGYSFLLERFWQIRTNSNVPMLPQIQSPSLVSGEGRDEVEKLLPLPLDLDLRLRSYLDRHFLHFQVSSFNAV